MQRRWRVSNVIAKQYVLVCNVLFTLDPLSFFLWKLGYIWKSSFLWLIRILLLSKFFHMADNAYIMGKLKEWYIKE